MQLILSGHYPLFEAGRVYDRYLMALELSKESPRGLPIVCEIGHRIPHDPNRHINPVDGTACVVLPDAFWYENPDGMGLIDFLGGPLRSFFVGQSLFEEGVPNPWHSGEWQHGIDGILDFYGPLVGSTDPEIISNYLVVLGSVHFSKNWFCPCGQDRKLKRCHLSLLEQLRARIPPAVAARSKEILLKNKKRARP